MQTLSFKAFVTMTFVTNLHVRSQDIIDIEILTVC